MTATGFIEYELPGLNAMKFEGTDTYIATEDLRVAVNAAVVLERPLLIKGEPGTGKTMLAEEVARSLGKKLIQWHIKSTTKAQQGLYEYDAVSRLRDSQLGNTTIETSPARVRTIDMTRANFGRSTKKALSMIISLSLCRLLRTH